jgi:hypothetical protein
MQGWRGEQPRTITRLIARVALMMMIGAVGIVVAALLIGALIASDALAYRMGEGYVFRDLARGTSYWRDLDLPAEFIPEGWSNDSRHHATLTLREDGSRTLRVNDLRENAIRCEVVIPGDFVYTYFLAWSDDTTLLYAHSTVDESGVYRFDLATCTSTHLADVDGRLDYARIAKPYVAFIGERRGEYTVYVLNVETGDLMRLNYQPFQSTSVYAFWRPVDQQRIRGDSCCLMYGDGNSLHLYQPETAATQSINSVWGLAYWIDQDNILIRNFQQDGPITAFEFRLYANDRIGEPLVNLRNTISSTFTADLRYIAYVEVEAGATTLQFGAASRVMLLDMENNTTTPILPEIDGVDAVRFSPDGRWLLLYSRATGSSSVLYETATGAARNLALRLTAFDPIWRNQALLYPDINGDMIQYDLVEHTAQIVLDSPSASIIFSGIQNYEDYAAILTNRGSETCLYLLDQRQRSAIALGCSTMVQVGSMRWIADSARD